MKTRVLTAVVLVSILWHGNAFAVGCSGGCVVGFSGDFFWQAEAAVGLVVAF